MEVFREFSALAVAMGGGVSRTFSLKASSSGEAVTAILEGNLAVSAREEGASFLVPGAGIGRFFAGLSMPAASVGNIPVYLTFQ